MQVQPSTAKRLVRRLRAQPPERPATTAPKRQRPVVNLAAFPISRKFGKRPAHVWVSNATHAFVCEGLNPLEDPHRRRYAPAHQHISYGERFLRKSWMTIEGVEFTSKHCRACGLDLDAEHEAD